MAVARERASQAKNSEKPLLSAQRLSAGRPNFDVQWKPKRVQNCRRAVIVAGLSMVP